MSSSIIDQLIADGSLVLYHDYRSGSFRDWSGNGNDGDVQGTPVWDSHGIRMINNVSHILVADDPSLHLLEGTFIAYCRSGFEASTGYQDLIYKRTTTVDYEIYFDPSVKLGCYDGSINTSTVSALGKQYVALNLKHGETGDVFYDGQFIEALPGGTITMIPSTIAMSIGSGRPTSSQWVISALSKVLVINRKLTATEHAQLYGELSNMVWPSKHYAHAARPALPNINEPNVVGAWGGRTVDGELVDLSGGGNNGVVTGATEQSSIVGPCMNFANRTDVVAMGNVGNVRTVEFMYRAPLAESTLRVIDFDGGTIYVKQFGLELTGIGFNNPSVYVNGRADGTINIGAWNHIVVTDDTDIAATALTMMSIVGENIHTNIAGLAVYSDTKSLAWVQHEAKRTLYCCTFKTDWCFKESIVIEGGTVGETIGGPGSPFKAGDALWRGSVATSTVKGKVCKVLECTTTGMVYIPYEEYLADQFDGSVLTDGAFGGWEWWYYIAAGNTPVMAFSSLDSILALQEYRVSIKAGVANLTKPSGVLLTGSAIQSDAWNHFQIDRYPDGLFEFFQEEISQGTVTELITTTGLFFVFEMTAGDKLCLGTRNGGHSVVKFLGPNGGF